MATTLFVTGHQTAKAIPWHVDHYPVHIAVSSGEALHCDEFTAIQIRDALTEALTMRLPGAAPVGGDQQ